MELEEHRDSTSVFFRVRGQVVAPEGVRLRDALVAAVESSNEPVRIVVDLEGVTKFDTSALNALHVAYGLLSDGKRGRLVFRAASPVVREVFRLARMLPVYEACATQEI